jgi:hypothetical protein
MMENSGEKIAVETRRTVPHEVSTEKTDEKG